MINSINSIGSFKANCKPNKPMNNKTYSKNNIQEGLLSKTASDCVKSLAFTSVKSVDNKSEFENNLQKAKYKAQKAAIISKQLTRTLKPKQGTGVALKEDKESGKTIGKMTYTNDGTPINYFLAARGYDISEEKYSLIITYDENGKVSAYKEFQEDGKTPLYEINFRDGKLTKYSKREKNTGYYESYETIIAFEDGAVVGYIDNKPLMKNQDGVRYGLKHNIIKQ